MPIDLPPLKRIRWNQIYRIVPSRFPPVGVFDRIANPADLDAVFAIEALTNPRLREEAGALKLVPKERRISGPGSTPVMAAFTHLNPEGSRFSDGSWGVFYAAHNVATAVEETVYHREQFLAATAEPACEIQMRCYRSSVDSKLHDLRGGWLRGACPGQLRSPKRRARPRTACCRFQWHRLWQRCATSGVDVLLRSTLTWSPPCVQAQHLIYRWDGTRIAQVLEVSELKRPKPDKT